MNFRLVLVGVLLALSATLAADSGPSPESPVGSTFKVPYRLTDTNHFLVRIRINGKGPFNFLVDTGAPALFVGTEAAKAIDLKPAEDSFWTDIDRLEFEGGPILTKVKARVEDPFQLVGMNALGLPGASIDGILGFTILAKFRIELDPTKDRMVWTRLDYNPKEPFVPKGGGRQAPADVQAMNLLGPVAKFMAVLVGKQPEETRVSRGFLGIEFAESSGVGAVEVARVFEDSPAAAAGLKPGDRLATLSGKPVASIADAHRAASRIKSGDRLTLKVRRGDESLEISLTAGKGF